MMGSYGRVSRYGLIAFASSLDRIGPFARTVEDVAAVLQVMAGRDPNDSTSTTAPVEDYAAELKKAVKGMKIGIPKEYFGEGMDAGVRAKIEAGIELLRKLGCELMEIRMPHTDYAIATYYIIATAEASSNLARYDGVRYGPREESDSLVAMYRKTRGAGFGAEVKRRIVLGTYVLVGGLLRRVLPEGAESARADCAGFPGGVSEGGCDCDADFAGAAVQIGGADERSAADVSC